MMRDARIAAIIPAAGQGRRMNGAKQFLDLGGKPVVLRTLLALQNADEIDDIVVAARPGEFIDFERLKHSCSLSKIVAIVPGGSTRQGSVWNALQAVRASSPSRLIAVHDAVRPLLRHDSLVSVIEAAMVSGAAILAVRPKDTVKTASPEQRILSTPPRDLLWLAQTPQVFDAELLWSAFIKANSDNFTGTDESSLVERLGAEVQIVEGSEENIKITTPGDLILAESLLSGVLSQSRGC